MASNELKQIKGGKGLEGPIIDSKLDKEADLEAQRIRPMIIDLDLQKIPTPCRRLGEGIK